jgi:hypothetical protein
MVEPVYNRDDRFVAMKKTIKIAGLKVYEKTCRPLYNGKVEEYELYHRL